MAILLSGYNTEELETLCEPTYKADANSPDEAELEAQALDHKRKIAAILIPRFKNGNQAARDEWKVAKYQQIIDSANVETPDSPIRTATIFDFHGLLNSFRLFLIRIHRFFVVAGLVILPKLFALWGLSCGLTFLADVVIVFKNTFIDDLALKNKIKQEKESNQSFGFIQKLNLILRALITNDYWRRARQRFINSMLKDNRPPRMLNDGLWFGLNLALFLAVGPLALLLTPLLNIIGFTFDAGISGFLTGKRYVHMSNIIKKLEANIQVLDANKPEHQSSIRTLNFMILKMKKERRENMKTRVRNTVFLSLVLVGMVLIFAFPPLTAPIGFAIGSSLALIFGTATGFYPKASSWFNKARNFITGKSSNAKKSNNKNRVDSDRAPLLADVDTANANVESPLPPHNTQATLPVPTSSTASTIVQLQVAPTFQAEQKYQPIELEVATIRRDQSAASPTLGGKTIARAESNGSSGDPGSTGAHTPTLSLASSSIDGCSDPADDGVTSRLASQAQMKKTYSSAGELASINHNPQGMGRGMRVTNAQ